MLHTRAFLLIATKHLRRPLKSTFSLETDGHVDPYLWPSWSAFTTFHDLAWGALYRRGPLPQDAELGEEYIADFAWASCGPLRYPEIAHVLIPRYFTQPTTVRIEGKDADTQGEWQHEQDVQGLSKRLTQAAIEHGLTDEVLEFKRF